MKIFTEDPFAQYSAEEEEEFREEIFYSPNYYPGLLTALKKNSSRFLLGQRGDGKSVVIYKLMNDLKKAGCLPILIYRYDDIPLTDNKQHFLFIICKNLTIAIARELFYHPEKRNKLDKLLRQRLSHYIELFYDGEYSNEFIEKAKEIRKIKSKNIFIKIFNAGLINLLNELIGIGISVTSTALRNYLGISEVSLIEKRQFISELNLREIKRIDVKDASTLEERKYIQIINDLCQILSNIGFPSVVALFDKIDECPKINADTEKIADFCIEILTDTALLLSSNISIVFSLWSEIKQLLTNRGVRFDKFGEIKVTLRDVELIQLLNIRLKHFSRDKNNPVTFESLITKDFQRDAILKIADRSPRTLLRLLGEIYNNQNDRKASFLEDDAISDGLASFCKTFDFGSLRNSSQNNNQLKDWIDKILQIHLIEFSTSNVKDTFKLKGKKSDQYIESFINFGLIKPSGLYNDNNEMIYKVIDTRIQYMISRGITQLA